MALFRPSRRSFGALATLAAVSVALPALRAQTRLEKSRVTIAIGGKSALYYLPLAIADALQARAQAIARSFVGASPVALSLIKRSLSLAANDLPSLLEQEANAQALAMGTPEHREAVHCFLEKKPLPFQWPQA